MSGIGTRVGASYASAETFCPAVSGRMETAGNLEGRGLPAQRSPNFETIDGLLYRKKLERGFVNYREVLEEDRRQEALSTFHRRRLGQRHLSLEETYKCVAENYWWEGMYFQIRDFVLSCLECQRTKKTQEPGGRGCVTKTMASHGADVLSKLRGQREAGLFCDITLRTNGRSYSAHRAVLAAVSDHFQEIFTEMDSSMKADIDLTGFSEDSLLSLLDFSYSSTLCVRQEDLPEVIAMARHLGMWPAVEACSALMKEQERKLRPRENNFAATCAGPCERYCQRREGKRKRAFGSEDNVNSGFCLLLDPPDESFQRGPRRNLRRTPKAHNGLPLSPSHRMKLMDFKSPSSKKASAPRHAIANTQSQNYSRISPSNRLLRSTPGAAQELQRLLPPPESPRRNRRAHTIPQLSRASMSRVAKIAARSPVRVKQEVVEVGEDEQDSARAQEKYELMSVLGLQRTALLPRPEDLIGWRQKKRLRKLKANDYSLTKRRQPRPASPVLPYGALALSLPLCDPINTHLLGKSGKTKFAGPVGKEQAKAKRPKGTPRRVPPSDRSMRSQGALPDMFQPFCGRELRRSVRKVDGAHHTARQPRRRSAKKTPARNPVRVKSEPVDFSVSGFPLSSDGRHGNEPHRSPPPRGTRAKSNAAVRTPRYNSSRRAPKTKLARSSAVKGAKTKCEPWGEEEEDERKVGVLDNGRGGLQFSERAHPASIYNNPLYKVIKEEPADPVPVGEPFSDPPSPDLGKRRSKPPIKLLDSGFLFSFCRPAGGLKKEEESVDICLTRSVSQVRAKFVAEESPHRALRARGPVAPPAVKEGSASQSKVQRPRRNAHSTPQLAKSVGSKAARNVQKQQVNAPASGSSRVSLEAVQRARLKQLRGPRSQVPKVPKATHSCAQCSASYKDCDALIMHRLRHIEGKHWPCLLCSKTFFRLRNVRNHIHTHDPKLYKCRSCIAAGS